MHENYNGLISLASIDEIIALLCLVLKFLHDTRDEHANKETELRSYLVWHPGKRWTPYTKTMNIKVNRSNNNKNPDITYCPNNLSSCQIHNREERQEETCTRGIHVTKGMHERIDEEPKAHTTPLLLLQHASISTSFFTMSKTRERRLLGQRPATTPSPTRLNPIFLHTLVGGAFPSLLDWLH